MAPQGTPGRILIEEGIAIVLIRLKRDSKADRVVAKVWHPGPVLSCPPPNRDSGTPSILLEKRVDGGSLNSFVDPRSLVL